MTLEDFEKSLAEEQREKRHSKRERTSHRHRSDEPLDRRRTHTSSHHREDGSKHRRKRTKYEDERPQPDRSYRASRDDTTASRNEGRNGLKEKKMSSSPAYEANKEFDKDANTKLQRDAWMEAPLEVDFEYGHSASRKEQSPIAPRPLNAEYELRLHDKELNHHLENLDHDAVAPSKLDAPSQHDVQYTFGDEGSKWRMSKLKNVYRQAEETGRSTEDVALNRYGDLRAFDDAREEEIELERRSRYGDDYVGKIKPSGELFEERKLEGGVRRHESADNPDSSIEQEINLPHSTGPPMTVVLDATALNRLKAQMMKAKLMGAENAAQLEAEYASALSAAANRTGPEVVVLGPMDSRMLAGSRGDGVKTVDSKRGRERGLVEENEDMSIEDMVREEKRTRGQAGGEGRQFAERIAKDAKFNSDLDYMDENAARLAKRVQKSEGSLRSSAINDFQRMSRVLETCPLCHHEDTSTPPIAPVVSLATRTYLTLPTEPEISEGGACIVPVQHRFNLVECDDDEWEEIRNFMKCLTRMYHDQGRDVIFYENAAQLGKKHHASMQAVPLPYSLGETAPAFFREAMLSADEEWSQHRKLIDTLGRAKQGSGKSAFRRSLVKEMPYFHVWFELNGGLGHVVEDTNRWPKGDLFAREVIGGMLDAEPQIIKRQGRWVRDDRRVEDFRKRWKKFDWTRVLTDG